VLSRPGARTDITFGDKAPDYDELENGVETVKALAVSGAKPPEADSNLKIKKKHMRSSGLNFLVHHTENNFGFYRPKFLKRHFVQTRQIFLPVSHVLGVMSMVFSAIFSALGLSPQPRFVLVP